MADARFSGGRVRALGGPEAADARVGQALTRIVFNFPAEEGQASSMRARVLWAGSGGVDAQASQLVARILYRTGGDRRELRAWTFVQDDHTFYVLNLGNASTLVYDRLTQQWAQWRSPGLAYWRGADGTDWEGFNLCCDILSGKIFVIDPDGRLDWNYLSLANDAPITSIVTGQATVRFPRHVPCYQAELSLSEGAPALPAEGLVGLQLRTSDDGALTWLDHGTIPGEAVGEEFTVRWHGLGLMSPAGRVFEITDFGYARRIDGLDITVGGNG